MVGEMFIRENGNVHNGGDGNLENCTFSEM